MYTVVACRCHAAIRLVEVPHPPTERGDARRRVVDDPSSTTTTSAGGIVCQRAAYGAFDRRFAVVGRQYDAERDGRCHVRGHGAPTRMSRIPMQG